MLPAANRLRTAADFRETTRRGGKAARGCVVVYLNRRETTAPARVGVVVSKSVGGSVQRHRAARRIREAMRPYLEVLPSGSTAVVRALPGADRQPSLGTDVAVALDSLLRKDRR
ncbi:MAG: ribonuclease P protein component [Actinobacteria bacterium]|nr:ribonuclease P protein component [Actinomycetota bacterium]